MINVPNPELRAVIFEIVHNQLRDGTPPETPETLDRLMASGYTREQAEELIACALSAEIFDIMKQKKPFNEARFVRALHNLPRLPWEDGDNNDVKESHTEY